MRYKTLPAKCFIEHRKQLISKIETNSIVLLFSPDEYPRNGDQFFHFRQNSDLYHLCGIDQEETILMISPSSKIISGKELLFVKKIDSIQRIWFGEKLSLQQASAISGINQVEWNDSFDEILLSKLTLVDEIYYLETGPLKSFDDCPTSNSRRIEKLKLEFPEKKFTPINPILHAIRLIKGPHELKAIEKAIAITQLAYQQVLTSIKPGMKEYEIEAKITYEFLRHGAQGHAYEPIVAGGKNACILHYVENQCPLANGELLLIDFGAEYANYAADCSRTIPINGVFSARQKDCYQAVLRVFDKAKTLYVPGNTINKINAQVGLWMQDELINLGLLKADEVKVQSESEPLYKRYFMHGTAHFIGLDVHDVGSKDTPFVQGMVLSCEPGLYIEEENLGIRIETDMLVSDIPIDLMADFPVSVAEIEASMRHLPFHTPN
jgi:Xaa-Pro aminopeptidase